MKKCANHYAVAVDLGASGGKMAAASFDGSRIELADYITFPNQPVQILDTLYWDVFALYRSIVSGMTQYASELGPAATIGIDTWGASYGLLDKKGRLLEPVYHYRDKRTDTIMDVIYEKVSQRRIFELTGVQFNRTYTLPQLYSCIVNGDTCLDNADKLLFLPDLLGYFISGQMSTEMTIAGTSALMEPSQENWSKQLFQEFSIPTHFLTNLVDAGTVKGTVTPEIASLTGIGPAKLVASVGHDSAAAVAAIPGFGKNKLYISIGTQISMGIETDEPLVSEAAYQGGFKNTGGIARRKIIYRDFSAFWLINELRAALKREGREYSFDELHSLAEEAKSLNAYIDNEYPSFDTPGGDIRVKMAEYLQQTGQAVPQTVGEWVRCIFESLALKVKYCADYLKNTLGMPLEDAFVINGGSRNTLLVQLLSDALRLPIHAGMPYATLAGNLLTQFYADGKVSSVEEMREVAGRSFQMKEYEPQPGRDWDAALQAAVEKNVCH